MGRQLPIAFSSEQSADRDGCRGVARSGCDGPRGGCCRAALWRHAKVCTALLVAAGADERRPTDRVRRPFTAWTFQARSLGGRLFYDGCALAAGRHGLLRRPFRRLGTRLWHVPVEGRSPRRMRIHVHGAADTAPARRPAFTLTPAIRELLRVLRGRRLSIIGDSVPNQYFHQRRAPPRPRR